jgi:uncharacterized protein
MNLLQEFQTEGYSIRSYREGELQVGETRYSRSLLLAPDQLDPAWGPDHPQALQRSHFEQILALQPEIVLLGSGTHRFLFTTPEQQRWLQLFPGMEIMETGAACRTYNLLRGEGRRVVAGLIIQLHPDPPRLHL